MQTHQQWLGNKNYQHHMETLNKIKARSGNQTQRSNSSKKTKNLLSAKHNDQRRHTFQNSSSQSLVKNYKTLQEAEREKEVMWNNYLLGKRIIEIAPVISAKKQKEDYETHRKMVRCRAEKGKKTILHTQFRETKLKQYYQNSFRLSNRLKVQTSGWNRTILVLRISRIDLSHQGIQPQEVIVKMQVSGKKLTQSSPIFQISELMGEKLYFKYNATKGGSEIGVGFVTVWICEIKGLSQRTLGQLIIDRENIGFSIVTCKKQLFKLGKSIGSVCFDVQLSKKKSLEETL